MKMKNARNALLVATLVVGAVIAGFALRTPHAKADNTNFQSMEISLLRELLTELIQIDQDIRDAPLVHGPTP